MSAYIILILDIMLASMLAATIFYCLKLNTRIRILQDSKSELAMLIQQFEQSTQQATNSIAEMHTLSKKVSEAMQTKLEKANYIADDLTFLIDRGNKLADKIEGNVSGRSTSTSVRDIKDNEPKKRAMHHTHDADTSSQPADEAEHQAENTAPSKKPSALERLASKNVDARSAMNERTAKKPIPGVRLRSRAEQDLLDALNNKK